MAGKKTRNKLGKKLFTYALDGFFFFEDDKIEDLLDKTLIKFQGQPDWRKKTRAYLWSFQEIRDRICDIGYAMLGPGGTQKEEKINAEGQDIGDDDTDD